jgi:hypothetical protein
LAEGLLDSGGEDDAPELENAVDRYFRPN